MVSGLLKLWPLPVICVSPSPRQVLNLERSVLSGDGMRAIAEALQVGSCPELRALQLSSCGVDGSGAVLLGAALRCGSCPCLETLDLSRNLIGDGGVLPLFKAMEEGHCIAMRSLSLGGIGLGLQGGLALSVALSSGGACHLLEYLDLGINRSLGGAMGQVLGHLGSGAYPGLRYLNLTNCGIDSGGQHLLVKALCENTWPKLEVLKAACNIDMGEPLGLGLATALETGACQRLRELDLQCTFMEEGALHRIAAALKAGALPRLELLGVDGVEGVDWKDAVKSRKEEVQVVQSSKDWFQGVVNIQDNN